MSLAKKCDRCGTFVELGIGSSGYGVEFRAGLSTHSYDLCTNCAWEFKDWIKPKEEPKENEV